MKPSLVTLEYALKKAAHTLKSLPHKTFAGYASYWPDVVRSMPEIWLARPYQKNTPAKRTPQEISAMDEVLNWLFILTPEERRIVWARACNLSWRAIEDHDGRSHVTLRKIYNRGLTAIALALEAEMADPEQKHKSRFFVRSFQSEAVSSLGTSPTRIKVI